MKRYRDYYFKRAKDEKYPARSVYKLKELNQRFQFLGRGQKVLDLGAAPGSWTVYLAEKVGQHGQVVAVDQQSIDIDLPRSVTFIQEDVFDPSIEFKGMLRAHSPFDLVLSDMAPKTTGIKLTDQIRSLELAETARDIALDCLKTPSGAFVVKVFDGPDVQQFIAGLRSQFKRVKLAKPKSSRSESKEVFVLSFQLVSSE